MFESYWLGNELVIRMATGIDDVVNVLITPIPVIKYTHQEWIRPSHFAPREYTENVNKNMSSRGGPWVQLGQIHKKQIIHEN